jgi:hypothetical protein
MGKSTFLFSNPSFIEGMARAIDIGGTLQIYNESKTGEEADSKAIGKDWEAIGLDIKNSCKEYAAKK